MLTFLDIDMRKMVETPAKAKEVLMKIYHGILAALLAPLRRWKGEIMQGEEYQKNAMRTNDGLSTERLATSIETYASLKNNEYVDDSGVSIGGVLNGCLGLTGEAGEVADIVKKWIFHQGTLNSEHLKKELGDVMWYIAMICESMGWGLDEIMEMNVQKLKNRYPDGFDTVRANNRSEKDI